MAPAPRGRAEKSPLPALRASVRRPSARVRSRWLAFGDRPREEVAASLLPEQATRLHETLAEAIKRSGTPQLEALAHHLRGAGQKRRAAGYAARAAEMAENSLAFEHAVRLYTQALEEGERDAPEAAELRIARGKALENAGRLSDAAQDYLDALDQVDEARAFALRVAAAGALMRSGRIDSGHQVLAPTLAHYRMEPAKSDLRARLQLASSDLRLRLFGSAPPEKSRADMPHEMRRRIDIGWACVRGYTMVDQLRGLGYAYRTTLLARRAGDLPSYALASRFVGAYLTNLGQIERGRLMVQKARQLALRHGDVYVRAFTRTLEGMASYFCGDYPRSLELLHEGQTALREHCTGVHWELAAAEAFVGWALFRTGRFQELSQRVPIAALEGRRAGDLYLEVTLSVGPTGIAWLVQDDTDTVELAHRSARERWPTSRPDLQRCLVHEGETYLELYRGPDLARLSALSEEWLELRDSPGLRSETLRSIMLKQRVGTVLFLARAQPARRHEYLADAARCVRMLQGSKHPVARCNAGLARAAVACFKGDLELAVQSLQHAREGARATHQTMFFAAATRRLGELLGADEGSTLIAQADAAMREQAIVRPDRMAAMLAPACETR